MRRTGRKAPQETKSKTIQVGDLTLDCEGRRVTIAGKEINLTAKEFDLLELLVFNPNKVFSRENLLNIVWGMNTRVMCVPWMYISADCVRRLKSIPASRSMCIPSGEWGTIFNTDA